MQRFAIEPESQRDEYSPSGGESNIVFRLPEGLYDFPNMKLSGKIRLAKGAAGDTAIDENDLTTIDSSIGVEAAIAELSLVSGRGIIQRQARYNRLARVRADVMRSQDSARAGEFESGRLATGEPTQGNRLIRNRQDAADSLPFSFSLSSMGVLQNLFTTEGQDGVQLELRLETDANFFSERLPVEGSASVADSKYYLREVRIEGGFWPMDSLEAGLEKYENPPFKSYTFVENILDASRKSVQARISKPIKAVWAVAQPEAARGDREYDYLGGKRVPGFESLQIKAAGLESPFTFEIEKPANGEDKYLNVVQLAFYRAVSGRTTYGASRLEQEAFSEDRETQGYGARFRSPVSLQDGPATITVRSDASAVDKYELFMYLEHE